MRKTVTAVHSDREMLAQRRQAAFRDQSAMNALSVYAQLCAGFSLYLYGRVSTPGYFSTLLTAPALLLLILPAWFLTRRKEPGLPAFASASGKNGAKVFSLCFSLLHFLDAQLAFFAFCAVARDVMADFSPAASALAAASFCALGGAPEGLPRISRPLKCLTGGMLLYCGIVSVPHGEVSHFFPLLGRGVPSILRGALWMSGAAASSVWPLLACGEKECPQRFFPAVRAPLAAIGLGTVTYLVSVWLMPVYAMERPESMGWRMMLAVHMTPSIPAWSMAVVALMLLLLAASAYSASQAALALARSGGKQKTPRVLYAALLFLLVPACVTDPDAAEAALTALAPWRAAACFFLLCLLSLRGAVRSRGKADPSEGAA